MIDEVSVDVLLDAHGVVDTEQAQSVVASWRAYLDEHRSEITALQLLFESREAGQRVSYAELAELADRIKRPPHNWTADLIWQAYEAVEVGRVQHTDRRTVTDLVSLVRFALGTDDELTPYAARVAERYQAWLAQQEQAGAVFDERQRWWLDRMAEVVASSAGISAADLENVPFTEHGGVDGAVRDLGIRAGELLGSMNRELTA
ncbi:type I restriction-modification enzyme R subunit C-terminal domain-containing protein [Klenkia terrae]|uniref:type I restriction-modification enzyme R subunit C-terminal domain-containing protein n=1 Tax=Klenkia terrae TaxID=1052259 RepID=UPI003622FFAF